MAIQTLNDLAPLLEQRTKINENFAELNATKYAKPGPGIPLTDLAAAVQTSLGKADSALQSLPVATASVLGGVKVGAGLTIDGAGVLSASGTTSPNATTTTPGILQLAGDLGGTATAPTVPALAGKYVKPGPGIPLTDLAGAVQTSLGLANTSVQSVKTINGKALAGTGDAGIVAADVGASPAAVATVSVAASRALTNADAGKTLEATATGVILTVPNGLNLVPGVIVQKHSSGTSIAFSGGATGNGAATTLPITAQMAAIVPTATADAYRISGV